MKAPDMQIALNLCDYMQMQILSLFLYEIKINFEHFYGFVNELFFGEKVFE